LLRKKKSRIERRRIGRNAPELLEKKQSSASWIGVLNGPQRLEKNRKCKKNLRRRKEIDSDQSVSSLPKEKTSPQLIASRNSLMASVLPKGITQRQPLSRIKGADERQISTERSNGRRRSFACIINGSRTIRKNTYIDGGRYERKTTGARTKKRYQKPRGRI